MADKEPSIEQIAAFLCRANGDDPERDVQPYDQPKFAPVTGPQKCAKSYQAMAEAVKRSFHVRKGVMG